MALGDVIPVLKAQLLVVGVSPNYWIEPVHQAARQNAAQAVIIGQ